VKNSTEITGRISTHLGLLCISACVSVILKVKGVDIYIPKLTGKPWPSAVYSSKWCTNWQWH